MKLFRISFLAFGFIASGEYKKNIVLFIADDLGYNDVPWNSDSCQIPMSNLHALAKSGIILRQIRGIP